MIGRENISHVTMLQLSERFSGSDLTDKILNTETEVEKDTIKNIEVFKKIVTGDEFTVEEKYKPRYTIKPMTKFVYATNNLPRLDGVDDEGYYRRLYILPFEKRITEEEELKFDKKKILTQEAIDWLANISLREYLQIMDTKKIANKEESNKIITTYRESSNSVTVFLNDEFALKDVFAFSNHLPKTVMYGKYVGWCNENNLYVRPRKNFFAEVLKNPEYQECKFDGYDHIRNINIKPDGLMEKPETF